MIPSEARAKTEEAIRSKLPPDMMNRVWKAIEEACSNGSFHIDISDLDGRGRAGFNENVAYLLAIKGFKVEVRTYCIIVSWEDESVMRRMG